MKVPVPEVEKFSLVISYHFKIAFSGYMKMVNKLSREADNYAVEVNA